MFSKKNINIFLHIQTACSKDNDRDEFLNISVNNSNRDLLLLLERQTRDAAVNFGRRLIDFFAVKNITIMKYYTVHKNFMTRQAHTSHCIEAARPICEPPIDIFRCKKKPPSTFSRPKKKSF